MEKLNDEELAIYQHLIDTRMRIQKKEKTEENKLLVKMLDLAIEKFPTSEREETLEKLAKFSLNGGLGIDPGTIATFANYFVKTVDAVKSARKKKKKKPKPKTKPKVVAKPKQSGSALFWIIPITAVSVAVAAKAIKN